LNLGKQGKRGGKGPGGGDTQPAMGKRYDWEQNQFRLKGRSDKYDDKGRGGGERRVRRFDRMRLGGNWGRSIVGGRRTWQVRQGGGGPKLSERKNFELSGESSHDMAME